MGRGSQEWQAMDINALVDQHALLAYHSARATNPDFQLDIQREFDEETGELEVIPQDLGRVFLNLVSNACHATNERRVGSAADGGPYHPMLTLITRREDDEVQIRIRDNGTGIPDDVIEKIFNPFFTDQADGSGHRPRAGDLRRQSCAATAGTSVSSPEAGRVHGDDHRPAAGAAAGAGQGSAGSPPPASSSP